MKLRVLLMVLILALPTLVFAQDDDSQDYTLEVVGGEAVTLEFEGATMEGITVGLTTVTSNYPVGGMIFTTDISSENGDLTEVKAIVTAFNGSVERVDAVLDSETDKWVVEIFPKGSNVLPWRAFDFQWRITDISETQILTEPLALDYWDGTREWYRVENDYLIMYWFGIEEVEPEYIAEKITDVMTVTEDMRVAGFGFTLDYKPIAIVYGTRESTAEFYGSPMLVSGVTGLTPGMTIQTFGARDEAWFERQAECIHLVSPEDQTEQHRVDSILSGTVPHEVIHLYQAAAGVSGLNWWSEGQATYFTTSQGIYDVGANERITQLSQYQDLGSLQGGSALGTFTFEQDGCYAVGYDAGTSFIDFIVQNYGGLEAHRRIFEAMEAQLSFEDALEVATGKTFFELENEWRVSHGYVPLTLEDLDPSLLLTEAIDPLYEVGDTFDIVGVRPLVLNEQPGAGALPSSNACYTGTPAEIIRVGWLDDANYYEIDCGGALGWLPESSLP